MTSSVDFDLKNTHIDLSEFWPFHLVTATSEKGGSQWHIHVKIAVLWPMSLGIYAIPAATRRNAASAVLPMSTIPIYARINWQRCNMSAAGAAA